MKFWNGMSKKTALIHSDKLMVGDVATGEVQYIDFADVDPIDAALNANEAAENAPKTITLISITNVLPDATGCTLGQKAYDSLYKLIHTVIESGGHNEWDNGAIPRQQDIHYFNSIIYKWIGNELIAPDKMAVYAAGNAVNATLTALDAAEQALILGLMADPDASGSGLTTDQVNALISQKFSDFETVRMPFKGNKLVTIGDSNVLGNKIQPWLINWLGFAYSDAETSTGLNGHAPMAIGGTTIRPFYNGGASIYTRAKDAHYYSPDYIMVLVTGNDGLTYQGTINDAVYSGNELTTDTGNPTVYGAYMGMIEQLMSSCPTAKIVLVAPPVDRIDMNNDYSLASIISWEDTYRKPWRDIAIAIGQKYHLPVADCWYESGIDSRNATPFFDNPPNFGSPTGQVRQVHFNDFGGRMLANVIKNKF